MFMKMCDELTEGEVSFQLFVLRNPKKDLAK